MSWHVSYAAVFALGAASVASEYQAGGYSLEDLVRLAQERNRELQSVRQRVAEQRGLLRQAGLRPAPGLEVGFGSGRPLGTTGERNFSTTYSFQFETAGKRSKRIAVAEKAVALAGADLDQRVRELVFEIQTRFMEAVASRRKLQMLDRLAAVSRDSLLLTEARIKEGDAAPLERDLLLVEINRGRAQRAEFTAREQSALLELRRLAALRPDEGVRAGDKPRATDVPSLSELRKLALQVRPDLRIARLLEEQGGAELALAEAQGKPDVTISAGYSRETSSFDPLGLSRTGTPVPLRDTDNVLSAAVSIPLFGRRRNLGNVEAVLARTAGARLRREHLESVIPLEVEAAYGRWESARRALEVMDRGVIDLSEKNLVVIRQAYSLGQLRMLDVLNEQRRLIDTRLAYIDTLSQTWRALAELERAVGGPLK